MSNTEIKNQIKLLNEEFGLTTNEDGTVTTNSLKVAEYYGKGHNDVMKKIRKFIELIPELGQGNFTQSSYINEQNKVQPMFIMDRQGFSMLVNKFTGDEATLFTYKYTKAFEKMIELIGLLEQENKELTEALQEVETTVQKHGSLTEQEWNKIKRNSKYFTEEIYNAKSVKEFIRKYDRLRLTEAVDEIYNILKQAKGCVKYQILEQSVKELNKIDNELDFSTPMNRYIKTMCKDGIIKLDSLHIKKLKRKTV